MAKYNTTLLVNYTDYENEREFQEMFFTLVQENVILKSNYEDSTWCLHDDFQHENRFLKFNINEMISKKYKQVLGLLKAWVVQSLSEGFSVAGVQSKLHNVITAINDSQFFNPKFLNSFKLNYLNSDLGSTLLAERVSDILLFIDFSDEEVDKNYLELFIELNGTLKRANKVRDLPSTKDILKFSLCVEDYFSRDLDQDLYLKYYPIYLWWRITNIIPMRIVEFCNIPYKCIKKEGDMNLLVFKRGKNKKRRKKKIDEIPIPDEIVKLINDYKDKCGQENKFGQLIYFTHTVHSPSSRKIIYKQAGENIFKASYFEQLLGTFYSMIIVGEYGYTLGDSIEIAGLKIIERKIKPNDTRHFAFLNLMLQGYHPSEIARLGGHDSIYSQYSYHNHIEHWVDSDVAYLILSQNNTFNKISSVFSNEWLMKEKVDLFETTTNSRIELEIGYCVDPNQNCMVDSHFLCKHWRIDYSDYIEQQQVIEDSLKNNVTVFESLIEKLFELHKTSLFNSQSELYNENNPLFQVKFSEYAKAVRQSILNINHIKGVVGNVQNR